MINIIKSDIINKQTELGIYQPYYSVPVQTMLHYIRQMYNERG